MSAPVSGRLPACPHCGSDKRQVKAGFTAFRTPRLHCHACDKDYTPEPKKQGYGPEIKHKAVALYIEGLSFRRIARVLGVNHQTVVNWVTAHQKVLEQSGEKTLPSEEAALASCEVVELDEIHTFIGQRRDKQTPEGEKKKPSAST